MCESAKFYVCKHCGNLVSMIHASGVKMICCGEEMSEIVPNTVDAAQEKHVPVVTVSGSTVTVEVGAVPHPMLEEHFIQWIYLETEQGIQRKCLKPAQRPKQSSPLPTATRPSQLTNTATSTDCGRRPSKFTRQNIRSKETKPPRTITGRLFYILSPFSSERAAPVPLFMICPRWVTKDVRCLRRAYFFCPTKEIGKRKLARGYGPFEPRGWCLRRRSD
jgi:superoxide reductase